MNSISTNYRELRPDEVDAVWESCYSAWQDRSIPERQYELAASPELEKFRRHQAVAPFDAFIRCMDQIRVTTLLDVGGSAGYYREVLEIAGFRSVKYTSFDFSPEFKKLAERLYPGMSFDVGDARRLPYHDDFFDVVLSGACLMHVRDYEQVIAEAARVSNEYVILHRTPVFSSKPTTFFEKEAYGVRCLEIHFNERELLELSASFGLLPIYTTDVFWNVDFGHRSYLLKKQRGLNHVQV